MTRRRVEVVAARRGRRLEIPRGAGATAIDVTAAPELPRVVALGLAQLGPLWAQAPHRHPHHELHYVRRGRGTSHIEGRPPITHGVGDVYFVGPGQGHGGTSDPDDPLQVVYLGIELPGVMAAPWTSHPLTGTEDTLELCAAMRALGEALLSEGAEARTLPTLLLRVLTALSALADRRRDQQAEVPGSTRRERELGDAVMRRIDLSADAPPPLRLLARQAGVSPAHLGRALLAATGKTFPMIQAESRVRLAQRLLQDTGIPVREVARRVGLSGSRALARLFKRMTGKQPSSFRS